MKTKQRTLAVLLVLVLVLGGLLWFVSRSNAAEEAASSAAAEGSILLPKQARYQLRYTRIWTLLSGRGRLHTFCAHLKK